MMMMKMMMMTMMMMMMLNKYDDDFDMKVGDHICQTKTKGGGHNLVSGISAALKYASP